eukprot:6182378-Pleurochrysis_carterae.AAC.3
MSTLCVLSLCVCGCERARAGEQEQARERERAGVARACVTNLLIVGAGVKSDHPRFRSWLRLRAAHHEAHAVLLVLCPHARIVEKRVLTKRRVGVHPAPRGDNTHKPLHRQFRGPPWR